MHFTIDALSLFQALERLNVRRDLYPFVQIQASRGQLHLLSSTRPACSASELAMQVNLQVEPATLEEEGVCAIAYSELLHAARTLPGRLTFELQEHALVVSGKGPLLCQTAVGRLPHAFPATAFKELAEQECYTKERSTAVHDACKHSHTSTVTDTYQITKVMKQRLRMSRDLLASMCAQVAWVAEPEGGSRQALTALQITLEQDVLSLAACGPYCFARRTQTLTGAGSWERPVLVPAARLAQALRLLPKGEEVLIETTAMQHQLITYGGEDARSIEPCVKEHEISLATDTMCVRLSPITGPFPHYQSLVPSSPIQAFCSTDALLQAVKAMVPAKEIRLTCGPKTLQMEAKRDQMQVSAHYEIPIRQNPDREQAKVILRCKYLSSLLKATTASEIGLAFTSSRSLVLFHAGGELDDYLVVLAPM